MANADSSIETRALTLLGQGLDPSVVASALGVTDGRISQLLADDLFRSKVTELKFNSMQKAGELDTTYNDIEGKLLDKLQSSLPLLTKPRDVLSAISVINGAKRRGAQNADSTQLQAKVVQLSLPNAILQQFVSNVHNQITEIRDGEGKSQTLVTAQSGSLEQLANSVLRKEQVIPSERFPESTTSEASQKRLTESRRDKGTVTAEDL